MAAALRAIEFVPDLGRNVARLEQDIGVLYIEEGASAESIAWVLGDVARWLAGEQPLHSRRQRHLRVVGELSSPAVPTVGRR